jgi:hypothetical protein
MLIRICDHFKNNPKRIDKLIAIKGLPKDWLFRDVPEGVELKKPWEPDVDANIPHDIRNLCEPMYIVQKFPSLEANKTGFMEKRQILGIKIDYNTEPGRQAWDDIERYVEESMPRDARIPVPVLCAKDERSAFDTYAPRRNSRGALELVPSPIPLVDLTPAAEPVKAEAIVETVPVTVPATMEPHAEAVQEVEFKCAECDYHHSSQRGIRMHTMKKHPKKEKAGIS